MNTKEVPGFRPAVGHDNDGGEFKFVIFRDDGSQESEQIVGAINSGTISGEKGEKYLVTNTAHVSESEKGEGDGVIAAILWDVE